MVLTSAPFLCVANDWAGHAVTAAAPASELVPGDRQDFNPGLRKLCVGCLVPLVADNDSRLERDDVVAVVPLVAFGFELVASCGDEPEFLDPERVLHLVQERTLGDLGCDAALPARFEENRP